MEALPQSVIVGESSVKNVNLKSATQHQLDIQKSVVLRFSVPGLGPVQWPLLVVRNFSNRLLLGMDFLQTYGATINTVTRQLTWNTAGAKQRAYLVLRRAVHLPAHATQKVTAKIKGDIQTVNFLCSSVTEGVQEGLYSTHQLNHFPLFNRTDHTVTFPRNTVLALAVPVPDANLLTFRDIAAIQDKFEPPAASTCNKEKKDMITAFVSGLRHLNYSQQRGLLAVLLKHHDAVSESKFDLGRTAVIPHVLRPKSDQSIFVKQFPIPAKQQEFINEQVDKLLQQRCIRPDYVSPHNSPVFAVRKPHSNELRLVIDMRRINDNLHDDFHSFMDVHQCLDRLGGLQANFMSALDLVSAYWQLELHPDSQQYTAFTVPGRGKFVWTVTAMGLKTSPSAFSRLMEYVFRGLAFTVTYLDDVLVGSRTFDSHLRDLEQCFVRLRCYNLKLGLKKCVFARNSLDYLGYKISAKGIQPGGEKSEAIQNYPVPDSVKAVRRFCGLANYFRQFIPQFAQHSAHLTKLLRKTDEWGGGRLPPDALQAFQHIKSALSSSPVLAFPLPDKPFTVVSDASLEHGFGAVLLQQHPDGLKPISFFSRALKEHEKNYSAFLLEMAGICHAIEYWHVYLYGGKFTVKCDHKPLEKLSTVHKRTLNRLQQLMNEYSFHLVYISGKENVVADALSRSVVACVGSPSFLRERQLQDSFCAALLAVLEKRTVAKGATPFFKKVLTSCLVEDGVLYYATPDKNGIDIKKLFVTPVSMQHELLRAAHAGRFSGHKGVTITWWRLSQSYWWPAMQTDVQNFVRSCAVCQAAKDPVHFKRNQEPLCSMPCPDAPNFRVHMDLFVVGRTSECGNKYILVMTDAFSKLVEIVPLPDKHATTVARAFFDTWVCRYSVPKQIVSDRGLEFVNSVNKELCQLLGISHLKTSAYHPQTNSSAESFNRELSKIMRAIMSDPDVSDWESFLPVVQLSYNSVVRQATQQSPFFLTYLHDPNLPYFDMDHRRPLYGDGWAVTAFQRLQHAYKSARNFFERAAARDRAQQGHSRHSPLAPDTSVWLHRPELRSKVKNKKWLKLWTRAQVQHVLTPTTYVVRCYKSDGSLGPRMIVHRNRLKLDLSVPDFISVPNSRSPDPPHSPAPGRQGGDASPDPRQRRGTAVQHREAGRRLSHPEGEGPAGGTPVGPPRQVDDHRPRAGPQAPVVGPVPLNRLQEQGLGRLRRRRRSGSSIQSDGVSIPGSPGPPHEGPGGGDLLRPRRDSGEGAGEARRGLLPRLRRGGDPAGDGEPGEGHEGAARRHQGDAGLGPVHRLARQLAPRALRSRGPVPEEPLPDRPLEWRPYPRRGSPTTEEEDEDSDDAAADEEVANIFRASPTPALQRRS